MPRRRVPDQPDVVGLGDRGEQLHLGAHVRVPDVHAPGVDRAPSAGDGPASRSAASTACRVISSCALASAPRPPPGTRSTPPWPAGRGSGAARGRRRAPGSPAARGRARHPTATAAARGSRCRTVVRSIPASCSTIRHASAGDRRSARCQAADHGRIARRRGRPARAAARPRRPAPATRRRCAARARRSAPPPAARSPPSPPVGRRARRRPAASRAPTSRPGRRAAPGGDPVGVDRRDRALAQRGRELLGHPGVGEHGARCRRRSESHASSTCRACCPAAPTAGRAGCGRRGSSTARV